MKSVVAAIVCAIVAFAGMYFYMQPEPAKSDTVPVVNELPPQPEPKSEDEAPPEKSKSNIASANRSSTPANPPGRAIPWAPRVKPTKPAKAIYYRVVPNQNGGPVPSRVIIYNTQIGDLTILLIGASSSNGKLFTTRGNKKNHPWEVNVTDGELTVYWDGESVPPG